LPPLVSEIRGAPAVSVPMRVTLVPFGKEKLAGSTSGANAARRA
jgi:hypothetical protein